MKRKLGAVLVWSAITIIMGTGCRSPHFTQLKPGPAHERGWIGGEYEAVGTGRLPRGIGRAGPLPKTLTRYYRRGVLLITLASNAPARLAGLREGDLIVELNHQSLSNSADFFWNTIDRAEPGSVLPIKAWRDGQTMECNVTVGRETWEPSGYFSFSLLPIIRPPDLVPNPGWSLMLLGYEPIHGRRGEIDTVRNRYLARNELGQTKPYEGRWYSWFLLFSVEHGKRTVSQEAVPLKSAPLEHP